MVQDSYAYNGGPIENRIILDLLNGAIFDDAEFVRKKSSETVRDTDIVTVKY